LFSVVIVPLYRKSSLLLWRILFLLLLLVN